MGNACAPHVQRIAIFSCGFRAENKFVLMIDLNADDVIIVGIVDLFAMFDAAVADGSQHERLCHWG